jgi:tetratricopeptide (TPR) repeat protein
MAKKLTRKDMKRNELVETMERTVGYVSLHRRGVIQAAIGGGILVLLVAGFFAVRAYRKNQAGKELSAGLAALDVPIAGQPAAAGAPKTYPSAAERDKAAEEHLRRAAGIRGTAPGRAAAMVLAARSSSPDAAATLERLAREGKAEVAASAELDAARLLAAQGKKTEAIERLKRAIESPASAAPKDALLFALGQIYEESGSQSDARAAYQRLISDYPNSPYRTDARQKIPGS